MLINVYTSCIKQKPWLLASAAATYLFIGWVTSNNKCRVYKYVDSLKCFFSEVGLCFSEVNN